MSSNAHLRVSSHHLKLHIQNKHTLKTKYFKHEVGKLSNVNYENAIPQFKVSLRLLKVKGISFRIERNDLVNFFEVKHFVPNHAL